MTEVEAEMAATQTARHEPSPRPADPLAQAGLCAACPKLCRPTCPVQAATGRESVAPWRISVTVRDAQSGGWDDGSLHAASSCTGCGACSHACLAGVTLPDESRAARAQAATQGVVLPAARALARRIAATGSPRRGSPWGAALADGSDPAAPTMLHFGCAVQSDVPQVGYAARLLFSAARQVVRCAADEGCCGAAALDVGLAGEARQLAAGLAAQLAGVAEVVVISPGCARVIRDEWPDWGLTPPTVRSAVEWLAAALADGALTLPAADAAEPVAWHDPCTLARGLGVVAAPRAVLTALGVEVREPADTGLRTRCSGAGAGYPLVDPGGAEAVAAARRAELEALDADVATACPAAMRALGARDILELAADRIAPPTGP